MPGFASWDSGAVKDDKREGALSRLASLGDALSYLAVVNLTSFQSALSNYKADLKAAIEEVKPLVGPRAAYAQALLATALN